MKIKRSFIAFVALIGMMVTLASCEDWGKMDPAAGTDVYPTREKMGTVYGFNDEADIEGFQSVTATECEIVYDDSLYNQVLHLVGGEVVLASPLKDVKLQKGAGFTFWLRVPEGASDAPVLSIGGAELKLKGSPAGSTELLTDGLWHFVGFQVWADYYELFIDGKSVAKTAADNEGVLEAINASETLKLLAADEAWFDDLTFIRNLMTAKDVERPTIKKGAVKLPDPVYFNDFNSGAGDATIVGGGSFRSDDAPGFGKVFQNITGGMRQNYLLLPSDVLSHSAESQKMTIGVWVNSANAGASTDYMWAPLFMAYGAAPVNGENTFPMFACQYRGVLQVNNNGWTDYTDVQNVDGVNKLYHADTDWLADKQWHYYTAVFNGENAKVYFDGVVVNEWEMDGSTNTQTGLFNNGADLKYVCLGGNQAWNWGDNDPGFAFDDIVIYDDALNASQIEKIMTDKPTGGGGISLPTPVFFSDFTTTSGLNIVGGGSYTKDSDPNFGDVFQNVTGGMRQNYLLLPEDALSHSAESKQMSIGVWVNAANAGASADYMWAPLFMAYGAAPANGENTWPMFACQYRGVLQVNNNGWTDYTDVQNVAGANKLYHDATDWLADKAWHYYTAVFDGENAKVYFDGVVVNEWEMDGTTNTQMGLFTNGADLKYICLGGNQAWNWGDNDPGFAFDDIAIYDIALDASDIQNIMTVKMNGGQTVAGPQAYYRNQFENADGVTIVGGGSFKASGDAHGTVFQNITGGMRQNYLLLPEDLLTHSAESEQLSISVWVNAANAGASADYMWAPLLMAYAAAPANGENTWPMFACQYRGVLQVNNNGWTDYTDVQNVAGVNKLYHDATDWLADKKWHLYTVVFDGENAKVYLDGVLANEWQNDGTTNTQKGLFTNGGDLKYICLGGNQAWNWGDNDPGFAFDDIQFFDFALTESDIQAILKQY